MRQKKARALRQKLGLKLPVKADLRVAKEIEKIAYFTDNLGNTKAVPVKRKVIVNAAKYQYRQIKKMLKGA